ncbi:hypothetical protein O6H91_06G026200 [Diphasiastrum complanatum]|uniref:Uncharacterized protein n=1 Tax=Diphasiastrum complanatum TaxID=34168 RepID=A0ACC2DBS5_DIPCM|nr:hypothetical protein O6H91_06G026200 [Diphasiastrum complanatum]
MTWPHHPSGRYSNGRLLTDFVAKAMGNKSTKPYRLYTRSSRGLHKTVKYGLNFAVAGSGVFEAYNPLNFSVQVDQLKSVLQTIPPKLLSLQHTLVLVSINGNDYGYFLATNGSFKELPVYVARVVSEIIRNIQRLYGLGLRRFVLGNLGTLECLPDETDKVAYKSCVPTYHPMIQYHNRLLAQELNTTFAALKGADFFMLDQYRAFSTVIANPSPFGIKHRLQPCCAPKPGTNGSCGQADVNGEPLYDVCSNPETHLFWDEGHPSQAGWNALASISFVQENSCHNNFPNLAAWLQNGTTSQHFVHHHHPHQ